MEPVYVEATINDRLIRMNKNDSLEVYIWRDCKTKPSYWWKLKPSLHFNIYTNNERYSIKFNNKTYGLSRLVYKAHNPEWDITDISDSNFIDHINNKSVDNRIENLRILNRIQNGWNSNAKGYTWNKINNNWRAKIQVNGKEINLGSFKEESDARNAYLEAKSLYHHIA